jgi:acyl-CoA reductase-like NAD-dependent aldehyde dehydrogenase
MIEAMSPTSPSELDAAIQALQDGKARFARLSIPERLQLVDAAMEAMEGVENAWVSKACEAKGILEGTSTEGEEWIGGPMMVQRNLRLLRRTLCDIRDYGLPQLRDEDAVRVAANGQTVVDVFPFEPFDKVMYQGFSAEIWMEPEITPDNLRDNMAAIYRDDADQSGAVSLVLGAGNVASIGPMDVLYKLFAENEVCLLKMNPVNEYLGPFIEEAFAVFVNAGFLRVVYGGAEVGDYLCKHEGVETIHITGSDKTHDVIVWGPPGAEQDERKKKGEPINTKPISSELGNVSPVIVVPGPWTAKDVAFQAANVASMVANNASFNCNAAKVIIQQKDWEHRDAFIEAVEQTLAGAPARKAYYPGAAQRYERWMAAHPEAKPVAERTEGVLPWTIARDVDSSNHDDVCFTTEAFCGVLTETSLDTDDPVSFLKTAVDYCNNHIWGTLNVTMIVHPKTMKEPGMVEAVENAVADLKYGTVAINHWAALAYGLVVTTWGAHPGHTLDDIQSGRGVVHNVLLFDKPQKTVVRGPFRMPMKPPWFVTNKATHRLGPRLSAFEKDPNIFRFLGIAVNSLGG